jgi:hypothetical protein
MREQIQEIIQENYNTYLGTNEAELQASVEIEELLEENSIEFLRWVIDNYCIGGTDTFYLPDTDNELNAKKLFKIYLKTVSK